MGNATEGAQSVLVGIEPLFQLTEQKWPQEDVSNEETREIIILSFYTEDATMKQDI